MHTNSARSKAIDRCAKALPNVHRSYTSPIPNSSPDRPARATTTRRPPTCCAPPRLHARPGWRTASAAPVRAAGAHIRVPMPLPAQRPERASCYRGLQWAGCPHTDRGKAGDTRAGGGNGRRPPPPRRGTTGPGSPAHDAGRGAHLLSGEALDLADGGVQMGHELLRALCRPR